MTLLPASAALAASTRATTSKVTLETFSLTQHARPRRNVFHPTRHPSRSFASSPFSRFARNDASQTPKAEGETVSDQIRSLMRESAQPVTLITSFLPPTSTTAQGNLIHGATLSSFSSISLDPNLVCFSMKTPSKLADSLQHHFQARRIGEGEEGEKGVDFVVNILAETQAGLAAKYAVPGTPPLQHPPAEGEKEADLHPLEDAGLVEVKEGSVPVVKGSIGAFGCQVVDTVDLSQYATEDKGGESKSVLYIARVLHVYTNTSGMEGGKPLIYHRQKFVSTNTALTSK